MWFILVYKTNGCNDDLPALCNGENERRKEEEENYCGDCRMEMRIIDGTYICDHCGAVGDSVMVNEWIDNIWMKRKKSLYIRSQNIKTDCRNMFTIAIFILFLKIS